MNNIRKTIVWAVWIFICISAGFCFAKEPLEIIDPANVINVNTDKEFIITLDSNRTTGYQWQLAGPLEENKVQLVKTEYEAAQSGLAGAGGKEVWTFKAVNPGKTAISFGYVRPWEKGKAPVEEKQFAIIIKQGFCGSSSYGGCSSDSDCLRGGCSGQYCQSRAETGLITTCEYKECYDTDRYNVQCGCIKGQCQWTGEQGG